MKIYTIKIAVGSAYELAADGDYVRVRSSAVDLIIENIASGEKIEVSQGDDFEFTPFKNLRISHASGSEQTVKLIISKGKKAGSAQVGGNISVANLPAPQGAFTQNSIHLVSTLSFQIVAANTARRYLLIQNNDTSAVLRVGLAVSVSSTIGLRLMPGDCLELNNYVSTNSVNACFETVPTLSTNTVAIVQG